jgi:hypothetical protein
MEESMENIIEQFVDYLLPELTPYEASLYLYLFRNSLLRNGTNEIRIGKWTIIDGFCKGSRGGNTSYAHVSEMLASLEQKGCIKIGDTDRLGTLYVVILPKDIPLVAKKIASNMPAKAEEDYFTNQDKRRELFERDKWICQYCGEKVSQQNATLDHFIPQSKGGDDSKENLRTCCLLCNSIKSGKTYEEAAPFLLKSIQERRARSVK